MTTLLVAKQYIINFINKYEVYLKPLLKLILALTSLMMINANIGYMHRLDNTALVLTISLTGDISGAIWGCMGYTVLLCFTLFKTGSLAKSIFNAH